MYKNIMIATDGSDTAAVATERGMNLAASLGAKVTLFTVASPFKSDNILGPIVDQYEHLGVPIEKLADEGDPAAVILDVAEGIGTDLIVIGNRGIHGARRFFLSAVPNKVAHHSHCAVLVVKTT